MGNSIIKEDGFLPILVVIIIFAVSAISGATLYYVKERPEQNSFQSQPQPIYSPSTTDTPTYSMGYAPSQSPVPFHVSTSSPMPNLSPKVQAKKSDSNENLRQQFTAIEQEVLGGKVNGSVFSPSHSDRILNDLDNLESKGYLKSEVERLKQIVIELSPHLKDQAIQSTSPATSSVSPTSPPIPSCLKTNPTLIADITDFSKIQRITAPGSFSTEGPKGHSFIWTGYQRVPIYAPIDMVLDSGSYGKDTTDSPAQYLLFFKVKGSCDFQTKFDHVDEPVDAIKQNFSSVPAVADSRTSPVANRVELKAGDLVGYTTGTLQSGNWDFGLYNMAVKGVLKDSYGMHSYAVCWVDFYSSAKQQQYYALLEGPKLVCSF